MLKYVSKIALDILPSVFATIIGAYIVNHYITTKPGRGRAGRRGRVLCRAETGRYHQSDARASEPSADVARIPEPGVKAKGISERAMLDKTASEKPPAVEKSAEKVADKPAETSSIAVDVRRHQPVMRERNVARPAPAPIPSCAGRAGAFRPNTAPPAETAAAAEERRDANELARAAIERLRGAGDGAPKAQDPARMPDPARVPMHPVSLPPRRRWLRRQFNRFRRRSWSPRPQPRRPIRCGRRRRPIFRPRPRRGRSICVPRS